ncbi:hypothetical protein VINE108521_04160 [Vibrio neonatus]
MIIISTFIYINSSKVVHTLRKSSQDQSITYTNHYLKNNELKITKQTFSMQKIFHVDTYTDPIQ